MQLELDVSVSAVGGRHDGLVTRQAKLSTDFGGVVVAPKGPNWLGMGM